MVVQQRQRRTHCQRLAGDTAVTLAIVAGSAAGIKGGSVGVIADDDGADDGEVGREGDGGEIVAVHVEASAERREGAKGDLGQEVVVEGEDATNAGEGAKSDAGELVALQVELSIDEREGTEIDRRELVIIQLKTTGTGCDVVKGDSCKVVSVEVQARHPDNGYPAKVDFA